MRITEVSKGSELDRISALAKFLIDRSDDTAAPKKISTNAFLNLAHGMGISLTRGQLIDLVQQDPLRQLITSVQPDEIKFKGSDASPGTDQMSVDQARDTVNKMAKSAMNI